MKMNLVLSKSSHVLFVCLAFICHLHSLPLSDAAPVAELDQTSSYATSQNNAISSTKLSTVVREAVSSSVETLGANATLNNSTTCQLVNNIVTKLLEAGVQAKCKPRPLQELKQLFLNSSLNSEFGTQNHDSCLGLEKLPGVKDNIYYVTTSSSCSISRSIQIDSEHCYGNGNHSHCSMNTELQPIINATDELENYFPQYVLQIMCSGCSRDDDNCLMEHNRCYVSEKKSTPFYPLKRDTRNCDENGYEKWIFDQDQPKEPVVACSCRQLSQWISIIITEDHHIHTYIHTWRNRQFT